MRILYLEARKAMEDATKQTINKQLFLNSQLLALEI